MNKEEILAKSRQENKNRDIAEIDKTRSASRFAIIFTMLFTCIFAVTTLLITDKINYGALATAICMLFSMQLYRAIKSKNIGDILCAAVIGLFFLILTYIAVHELLNVNS
jgi:hypothetical protein